MITNGGKDVGLWRANRRLTTLGHRFPLWMVVKMRRIAWYAGLVVGSSPACGARPFCDGASRPAVTVLPSDTNTLRVYTGAASTVINPSVARGTLFGPAILHDQPVTVQHHVTVKDTSGNNALVAERKTVSIPGTTVADVNHSYAVDRKTMGRGSGFDNVTVQTGQTFNWPIHTAKHNYVGWVGDTQTTTTLRYAGTAKRDGIETYVFTATVPTSRITDPAMLAALPASMPKSLLNSMVPSLGLTMPSCSSWRTFCRSCQTRCRSATCSARPAPTGSRLTAGIVVDVASHEVRTAAFVVGSQLVPVGPVLDFTYSAPPLTVKAAAADAKSSADKMELVSTTLPLAALITGACCW